LSARTTSLDDQPRGGRHASERDPVRRAGAAAGDDASDVGAVAACIVPGGLVARGVHVVLGEAAHDLGSGEVGVGVGQHVGLDIQAGVGDSDDLAATIEAELLPAAVDAQDPAGAIDR
jgi:hypothetical protein